VEDHYTTPFELPSGIENLFVGFGTDEPRSTARRGSFACCSISRDIMTKAARPGWSKVQRRRLRD
jgi:hypothetical protein